MSSSISPLVTQSRMLSQIFSRSPYPPLRTVLRNLSTETRKESQITFQENQCQKIPNPNELKNYLSRNPYQIAIFFLDESTINEVKYVSLDCYHIDRIDKMTYNYTINRSRSTTDDHTNIDFSNVIIPNENIDITSKTQILSDIYGSESETNRLIDIQTYYRIVKNRESCIELDPKFSHKATLDYFNKILYKFNSSLYMVNILDLYLMINAKILNIDVSDNFWPNLEIIYNNTEDFEKFKYIYTQYVLDRKSERELIIKRIIQRIVTQTL